MKRHKHNGRKIIGKIFLCAVFLSIIFIKPLWADLYINLLAVNGTDEAKDKDLRQAMPKELKSEDILDTAGLDLDYDVNEGAYYVHGKISLGPKETKTIKIRVRDIWRFDDQQIEAIKGQIDLSLQRLKGTEYFEPGQTKKQSLLARIDYIVKQQEEFADNTQKRIDRFRVYADEIENIRKDSVSVKYWRSKPPPITEANTFKLVIELENTTANTKKVSKEVYLPPEVKPEHVLNAEGFELGYDPLRGQSFLKKEEELAASQIKRYEVGIYDLWNIQQTDIDNLKDRARKVYKLLEKTEYLESANYLLANIKGNLEKVDASQAQEKDIKEHINAFRVNSNLMVKAKDDVRSMEELLEAVRENLERSQLKNVLNKIKSFKSIADIAEAVFGIKPSMNNAWKIIIGIVIFVGIFTAIHFAIWGKRSKDAKVAKVEEKQEAGKGA